MDSENEDLMNWAQRADEAIAASRPPPAPSAAASTSEPWAWAPIEGWGTLRDYVVVRNDAGGLDVGCWFIPDDGSKPVSLVFKDVADDSIQVKDVGEFARGVLTGTSTDRRVSVKMALKEVDRCERMVGEINEMDNVKRALLIQGDAQFWRTCGYGTDSSWRLVKAAPGLLRK